MKVFIPLIFLSMLMPALLFSQVSYQQITAGLQTPEMDGGRSEFEFADINLDGYLDILSIGDHGNPGTSAGQHGIMVWLGSATGTWTSITNGDFGYGGIAVGDVNNDGFPDVGYGMHHNYSSTDFGDQLIEVALGDGTAASWSPWDDGLATAGESWGMFGTDFADIDNDGDLDIGSISFGSGSGIHIYLNNMDGSWQHIFGFLDGNSDMIFEFGDINRDGYADFIAGHEFGSVYFGDGTGNFVKNETGLPAPGWISRGGASLGDVDNDGGKDLAYINNNGGVLVYTWDETEGSWMNFSGTLPASGGYELTQLRDMNNDGFVDVMAAGSGTFRLWLGDGSGNWEQEAMVTTPSPGDCQAFRAGGDTDHNGFPDFLMMTEEGTWISYQNHIHFYRETSTPSSLEVSAVFPRGGEWFYQHSVQFIEWISAIPGNEAGSIKLEYSTTGFTGPWTLIAEGLPDNGRYQWSVPEENSMDCLIKMTVNTVSGEATAITPGLFTITDGTVGIEKQGIEVSHLEIFPNPFADRVAISISGVQVGNMPAIYNLNGKIIKRFPAVKERNATIYWYGKDDQGMPQPSGIYLFEYIDNEHLLCGRIIKK